MVQVPVGVVVEDDSHPAQPGGYHDQSPVRARPTSTADIDRRGIESTELSKRRESTYALPAETGGSAMPARRPMCRPLGFERGTPPREQQRHEVFFEPPRVTVVGSGPRR